MTTEVKKLWISHTLNGILIFKRKTFVFRLKNNFLAESVILDERQDLFEKYSVFGSGGKKFISNYNYLLVLFLLIENHFHLK